MRRRIHIHANEIEQEQLSREDRRSSYEEPNCIGGAGTFCGIASARDEHLDAREHS